MAVLRIYCILLLIILFLTVGFAYEKPLSEFGFSGLTLEKENTKECNEINVLLPELAIAEKGAGILSLDVNFTEYQDDSSYVTVSINDSTEKVLWPENFSCTQNCWARIFIPDIKEKETKIKLCAVLGGLTKKLEITSNTFIGIYDTPILSIENESPSEIFLGDRAKMSIIVSNTGTKASSIMVQFVHPDTRAKVEITSFDIVEGDSSASTIINPGETKQFDYYIKPTVISSYNLPSAALFFTNVFGEKQTIISNHPQMNVVKLTKINVSIVAISEQEPVTFKAIIKNNLPDQFNGNIIFAPQTAFTESVRQVTIQGNSEKEVVFEAKDLQPGKYSFFATIKDSNDIYSSNKIELELRQTGIPFEVLFAILGIITGVVIFAWIYFVKEK
ncbi:MAG: hypothetical protein WC462_01620 [archaeon]